MDPFITDSKHEVNSLLGRQSERMSVILMTQAVTFSHFLFSLPSFRFRKARGRQCDRLSQHKAEFVNLFLLSVC